MILLHDSISAGKTVNPWDSFCSFHERNIEEKSRCLPSSLPASPAGEMPEAADSRLLKSESPAAGLNDRWLVPGSAFFWRRLSGWFSARRCVTSLSTYDDEVYVYENPEVARGLSSEGISGPLPIVARQLASADDAVPHAGLPVVWAECRRASFHQCPAAHGNGDPAVSGAAADDRGSCGAARLWRRCLRSIRCGWNRWRGWRNARMFSADCFSC